MTRRDFGTLFRSFLAGAAATLADLGVLFVCVAALHLSPRVASIPALVAGGVVNFYGNRHFAFRATRGSLRRQALLYAATELVALVLNGLLFDAALRTIHVAVFGAMVVRLVTTHVVFLGFSYPVWRRVFDPRRAADDAAAGSAEA
ncbi:MAG: hypothetical protein NVS3B10_07750 [Polyangiales bacterium]